MCGGLFWHFGLSALPDGRHFGVYIWPKSEASPPESAMMVVSETGEMQINTLVEGRWDVLGANRWPLAAAASPSGKSIVWLKDREIWVWREDKRDKRFHQDGGESLADRIEGLPVQDAIMRADGILLMFLEDGRTMGYFCDEDIVLDHVVFYRNDRYEDYWIPASKAESPCRIQTNT